MLRLLIKKIFFEEMVLDLIPATVREIFVIVLIWSLFLNGYAVDLPDDTKLSADILAYKGTDNVEVSYFESPGMKVGQAKAKLDIDLSGYVLYCPCMGRFGNQAEHLVGALAFAKAINRTLAIPPFRTYINVPFTDWFKLEPMQEFHRVLTMEDFVEQIAPELWPTEERTGYCVLPDYVKVDCEMKQGSPFGPFWDSFGIDFHQQIKFNLQIYADLSKPATILDTLRNQWEQRFPPSEYPVIALKGAPAPYPTLSGNRFIHQYIKWSEAVNNRFNDKIQMMFHGEKYLAIHLRNGLDWVRACEHAQGRTEFMASPQCHIPGDGNVTYAMCLPSELEILTLTEKAVEKEKAKHLYIATDNNSYEKQLQELLQPKGVTVHKAESTQELVQDLYFMSEADYFIGNCVSSVTSFVKRQRDSNGRRSGFFGLVDTI